MKVKFWGVRGSIPTPGPKTMNIGGNTACLEILPGGGRHFIIDMGTGIRELGMDMMGRGNIGKVNAHIFLSHTHWDHIHGFPFFVPAFIPGNRLRIYGPVNSLNEKLEDIVSGQMKYSYFPVPLDHMASSMEFHELKEGPPFEVEGVKVTAKYLNHPILVLGYRFEYNGKVVVTEFDTEPYSNIFKEEESGDDMDDFLFGNGGGDSDGNSGDSEAADEESMAEGSRVADEMNRRVIEFARDADLLIFDAQYTTEEYPAKVGWGHSTFDDAIDVATKANVKRLAFFHHEPTRPDEALEAIEKECQKKVLKMGRKDVHVFMAREGMEIDL